MSRTETFSDMKTLVSVMVAEPSEIVCEGLRVLLDEAGGYNFLSPVHCLAGLDDRLGVARPDVLILNPLLLYTPLSPNTYASPRQQLAAIQQARPAMPVVALVYQYVEPSLLEHFSAVLDIHAGRSGLLTLLNSLSRQVESEETTAVESPEVYELSDRETDVLVLIAKGLSSKEIADALHISIHTVNSHRKNITAKTGIKSVAGLAVYAMLHNLME